MLTRSDDFPLISRYSPCSLFGRRVSQCRVCFFVAEVLPDHRGQNTVKGRLTQASKEKWRQALRGFFGGHVTERGRKRIPLLRQARLAKKHHVAGMGQCMVLWDWSQHHVVSGYRTLGASTERRQMVQDSHVGLATGVAERLSFVACSSMTEPHAWSSIGLTLAGE